MKAKIENSINQATDDFIQMSAKEMGLNYSINLDDQKLIISLQAGFPIKKLQENLLPVLESRLKEILPGISINLSFDSFIKAHQTQLIGKGLRGVKNTIAIASGKGGVGKSTAAVNLAVALARQGARVGLLDADIYGPSVPLMLGQTAPVQVQEEHYLPAQAHGIEAMSIGYLTNSEEALIWRGPMLAKALIQMLNITLWDELDYLFIDLPPGTGDIALSLVQKIPLTAAIVITTPQHVATLDAQKAITMFAKTGIHVLGLIENMSLHICSQCQHTEPVFGSGGAQKLADQQNLPLLGKLPLDARIRQDGDTGQPTAANNNALSEAFSQTALRAAIALAKRPLNYAGKFPDIVVE